MTKRIQLILLHTLGALAFLSIPILTSPDFNSGRNLWLIKPFLLHFIRQVLLLLIFYLNYYFLLPKLYFQGKKILFFGLMTLCFVFVMKIPDLLIPLNDIPIPEEVFKNRGPVDPKMMKRNFMFLFFEGGLFQFLFVVFLSFLMKISQRLNDMKNEKQTAEISYLKAQINPHFLFNTLNSIYALTLQKSSDASKAVLKLSGIMRYVVTESTQDFVALQKEIDYINDYIELQKLRLDRDVILTYKVNGEAKGKIIAPLLLIPFIENAFKYGINPDENSFISIILDLENDCLRLRVENSIVNTTVSETSKTEEGIKNTLKRLEITYPHKHWLAIKESDNIYYVDLKITLI